VTKQREDAGDTQRGGFDSGRSIALQWLGLLVPPTAWLLNLEAGYSLSHAACHGSGMLPLHLSSIAALLFAAVGGAISLVMWRRSGSDWPRDAVGGMERGRLLATLGLGGAVFFIVLILTQWIPAFIFQPCLRT
jgi:hypothetical protein